MKCNTAPFFSAWHASNGNKSFERGTLHYLDTDATLLTYSDPSSLTKPDFMNLSLVVSLARQEGSAGMRNVSGIIEFIRNPDFEARHLAFKLRV